ncbi:MAG TPA: hypothetical protein VF461_10215 [Gemmatimonadaceae bacterium]
MTSPQQRAVHSLLNDDALVVRTDVALAELVESWLPLHAAPPTRPEPRATIDVVSDEAGAASDADDVSGAPLLRFGGVQVRALEGDVLRLTGTSSARGRIDLGARRATIAAPTSASSAASESSLAFDVYSMLTLSAAFLVGRLGGALVHAGGAVDPEGRAWLLVGDTHAGKTTTCVSLVSAGGWRYLADDQVVLRFGSDGALVAEGWPRRAHLDEGFRDAVVTGTRATVDLRTRWGDRWLPRAPLGGVLMPAVHAERPTSLAAVADAASFAALVRQSPWLMADRAMAGEVMALLRNAASHPAFALSLGRDSYARGDVLAERLEPARAAGVAR